MYVSSMAKYVNLFKDKEINFGVTMTRTSSTEIYKGTDTVQDRYRRVQVQIDLRKA